MSTKSTTALTCLSIFTIFCSGVTGIAGGMIGARLSDRGNAQDLGELITQDVRVVDEESAVISVADSATPSVVSIVITQNIPLYENYEYDPLDGDFWDNFNFNFNQERKQIGTEEQQVGAGTGFLVSEDGLIISNRHVVDLEDASYTVIFNDGTKKPAKVLARDTLLDIAFLDIEGNGYKPLQLGSSANLKVGQRVIAIGNALGEFSNTVSTGIISGLSRDIIAGDVTGQLSEELNDVLQTDASINLGNSGGPLLDIQGNVIGVNVAVSASGENIGFAIPADVVRDLLERLQETGSIERPTLGVRYQLVTDELKEEKTLSVDYGALVVKGDNTNEVAIVPGSPAESAGLKENDIILEIDGQKIDVANPLFRIIQEKKIGDEIVVKYLRGEKEIEVKVLLERIEEEKAINN